MDNKDKILRYTILVLINLERDLSDQEKSEKEEIKSFLKLDHSEIVETAKAIILQ